MNQQQARELVAQLWCEDTNCTKIMDEELAQSMAKLLQKEVNRINGPARATYPLTIGQQEDMQKRFTYHAPKEGQPGRYEVLRKYGHLMAHTILQETPISREQSVAITKVEEAVFWANAAIARNE